jgi:hypothetical protein
VSLCAYTDKGVRCCGLGCGAGGGIELQLHMPRLPDVRGGTPFHCEVSLRRCTGAACSKDVFVFGMCTHTRVLWHAQKKTCESIVCVRRPQ